jgi:glycosyltransferase involved in cell wall biosynthesis
MPLSNKKNLTNNLTHLFELKEEIRIKNERLREKNERLKDYEQINARLINELKEKEATISNLLNTYSWKVTSPLRWALDKIRFCSLTSSVLLYLSRMKMIFNLLLLFLKSPLKFIRNLNPISIANFFSKFNREHPDHLVKDVQAKLESSITHDADDPDHDSALNLILNLPRLFLKNPREFLTKISPGSVANFFSKLNRMHPAELEKDIQKELGLDLMHSENVLGNYFQMLAIAKEERSVLVVDRFIPAYDRNSGALRMYSILKVLKNLGYRTTFIPEDLRHREPYESELRSLGIETVCGNINMEDYFRKNGPRFDIVILSEALAAFRFISLVRAYSVNTTLIFDTVDLHWVRLERAAAVTGDPQMLADAEYFKKMEHSLISCSDVIFTVTQAEKDFLLQLNKELDVHVVPNVHDAVEGASVPFNQRKDLMFIGHFFHDPNVDAVTYFVKEVFPLLQKKLGRIKFYIVGSNPTEKVLKLQSKDVVVTGYVPDVTQYFVKTRVFVAPLRFGAGMKGKIGQSMTFGLPVVTTNIGAEGMMLEAGKHVLVADNTEAFVEAVVNLYTNESLWQRLSVESKQHIHNLYSTSAMESTISNILEHLKK